MEAIDKAIAELDAHRPLVKGQLKEVAEKYGVNRSTLGRRWRRETSSKKEGYDRQRKLTPQQELELVKYIEEQGVKGLAPTREMVQNFASKIAQTPVSLTWVTKFINRHQPDLISKWITGMDRVRQQADSGVKYKQYYDLLHEKMVEYAILPRNIFNMDEKGFLIGLTGRSKRIFSKRMWEKGEVKDAIQDGSREFLTLIACICADGTVLPASLIYPATSGTIRSNWVEELQPGEHDIFITSSPTGWSNNEIGLAWLEQVFERCTKRPAGQWRLLILDGHSSHVSMDFLTYCDLHRILVLVFPPHSTHTLQPLDVVMFKPLSTAYSKALTSHIHRAQGLAVLKKGEFLPLFWKSWTESFTPDNTMKAFEATGISPPNADIILKRFNQVNGDDEGDLDYPADSNNRYYQRLLRSAVKDSAQKEARELSLFLHHITARSELKDMEIDGLRAAIHSRKKYKHRGKALDLQQREEYHSRAVFWSPRKVKEARWREHVREEEEQEKKLQKARDKQQKEDAKLLHQVQLDERRMERQRLKEVREKEKAEKLLKRQRQKEKRNAEKAIKLSQSGKRKASASIQLSNKRQKRSGVDAGGGVAPERSPAPPAKTTSRGRNVHLPNKYR
jgi:hypothetical protein